MQWNKLLYILLFILLMTTCGSVPEIHYYRIDSTSETLAIENPKFNVILGIEKFEPEQLYESDRIVYRESPYEVKFYNYHRWITPPAEIVTEKAIEKIAASGLFRRVVSFPHISNVDYLIDGTIKAFEELDENDEWYGLVRLKIEFIEMKNNTILWQDIVTKKTKARAKKPVELVRAIDMSLTECIHSIIPHLEQELGNALIY
ncbi:hypothetical protein GF337_15910 [candidate division KSB1 bacterium]|nr:hypothetical protein [candidate division KSB1 bacterium]